MDTRKIVMFDQDEVITKGGLLLAINKFLKTNYPEEYFKNFYMQNMIPENRKKEFFYDYLPTCDLYEECIIIDGAIETIMKLDESGLYKPYIVTDWRFPERDRECGWNLLNKHDFLMKNIPLDSGRFQFAGDKSAFAAHIRVDDRLNNLTEAIMKPERMFLFSAYHSKELTAEYLKSLGVERVENYKEIERKLLP